MRSIHRASLGYVGAPRGARVDISIFVALLLVILTTGDAIVTWLVARMAPGLLPRLEATAPVVRLILFGGVPATIVAMWGLSRLHESRQRRKR